MLRLLRFVKNFLFIRKIIGIMNSVKEKILHVLRTGEGEIQIADQFRERAKKPLEKMLQLGTES